MYVCISHMFIMFYKGSLQSTITHSLILSQKNVYVNFYFITYNYKYFTKTQSPRNTIMTIEQGNGLR